MTARETESDAVSSLARTGAFSDGVFAIAITLLVLDVRPGDGGSLLHRLAAGWPHYVGFALSFLTIGLMWVNHHRLLRRVTDLRTPALLANLALLAAVSFLPFPTRILAEHAFDAGPDATTAAAFYAVASLAVSGSFFALTEAIRHDQPVHRDVAARGELGRFQVRGWAAPLGYTCAFGLALVHPALALPFFVGLPLLFVAERS